MSDNCSIPTFIANHSTQRPFNSSTRGCRLVLNRTGITKKSSQKTEKILTQSFFRTTFCFQKIIFQNSMKPNIANNGGSEPMYPNTANSGSQWGPSPDPINVASVRQIILRHFSGEPVRRVASDLKWPKWRLGVESALKRGRWPATPDTGVPL